MRMTEQGLRRLGRRAPPRADRPVPAPASRSTCATGRCGRRTSRSSRSSRAAPAIFRRLHTPGLRGLDGLALPPDRRAHARRRPRASSSRTWTSTASTSQVMHPNLSLFGLYSDDHELSMAHARVYNDYVVERFTPYFDRHRADRAGPAHRHRRRGRRDRARRRGGLPRDPAAGDAAAAVLLARLRPGVGRRAGQRRARVHPHADRRREGQRPDGDDAQGRDGAGRAGQPADDREVGVEADDHAVRLQPDRPAAGHVRAHRRRRRRALPRPALRADRVQRALARVAGRRAWTSAGSPASARTPTGGSATGTTPARRRPAAAWRSCSA